MKAGKTGSRLLSAALCALITILVIKLAVTLIGAFHTGYETTSSLSEAIAKDEKPKAEVESAAPADTGKSGNAVADSFVALQQKENDIRKKEDQLKDKEDRLAKLEKEVEQKIKDLLALQKQIQALQNEKQESQNSRVRGLAKIYSTMKPKEAAKLMDALDDKLVMGIIGTMTPDQAAAILALMEVKKAAKISEALSSR